MELKGTLVKTAKGVEEIQTRTNRLVQRKRGLLILIDGNTSVEAMVARFPGLGDIRQALQELVEDGYAALRDDSAAAVTIAATKKEATAYSFREDVGVPCRTLYDLIGPTADDFTGRLEGARDRTGFLRAIQSSVKIVGSLAGNKKAELFEQWAMDIADRHFKK